MKDVCFVERLLPGFKGSELVQTINFEDTDKLSAMLCSGWWTAETNS